MDEKFVLSAYQRALLLHQGSLGLIPTELISQVSAMVDGNDSQPKSATAEPREKSKELLVKANTSPQEEESKKSKTQRPTTNTGSGKIADGINGKDVNRNTKTKDVPPETSQSKDKERPAEQDEDEPPPNKKVKKVQSESNANTRSLESSAGGFLGNTEVIESDTTEKSLPDASKLPKLPGMDDRLSALCLSWYYAGYKAGYSS